MREGTCDVRAERTRLLRFLRSAPAEVGSTNLGLERLPQARTVAGARRGKRRPQRAHGDKGEDGSAHSEPHEDDASIPPTAGGRQDATCATFRAQRSIYCAERSSIAAVRPDARSDKSTRGLSPVAREHLLPRFHLCGQRAPRYCVPCEERDTRADRCTLSRWERARRSQRQDARKGRQATLSRRNSRLLRVGVLPCMNRRSAGHCSCRFSYQRKAEARPTARRQDLADHTLQRGEGVVRPPDQCDFRSGGSARR